MNCEFKPLQVDDLHLLHDWFHDPTIRATYAQNRVWTMSEIREKYLPTIRLDLLAHHPDVIPQLAAIWMDVLGKVWLPQIDVQQVMAKFATHLNEHDLPVTVMADADLN